MDMSHSVIRFYFNFKYFIFEMSIEFLVFTLWYQ